MNQTFSPLHAALCSARSSVRMGMVLALSLLPVTLQAQEPGDDPVQWLPADAGFMLHLDNPAAWRRDWQKDPLKPILEEAFPKRPSDKAWEALQHKLNLSEDQLLDRYLGRSVTLVAEQPQQGAKGFLISRVEKSHADDAIEKLELKELEQAGRFRIFSTPDQQGRLGYADPWMVLFRAKDESYARQVLSETPAPGSSLASDPQYQQWVKKLPTDRSALLYMKDPRLQRVQAWSLTRKEKQLQIQGVAHSPEARSWLKNRLGKGEAFDFGPLPKETMMAVSLNLKDEKPDPRLAAFMDQLVAPKSFEKDIYPHLQAPSLMFMGAVPADKDGRASTAVGLALKVDQAAVFDQLDQAIDKLVLLANFRQLRAGQPAVPVRVDRLGADQFRLADWQQLMQTRLGDRLPAPTTPMAYGRVGDWYILTTDVRFYRRCLEARDDPQQRLINNPAESPFAVRPIDDPLATMVMQGRLAADQLGHLQAWLHDNPRNPPIDVKGLEFMQALMGQMQAMTVQLRAEDEEGIGAVIDVSRP